MVAAQDAMVDEIVADKKFGPPDFLEQQSKSLADEYDVAEVVSEYARRLGGDTARRKFYEKKAGKLKALLTPRGVRKLCNCRIDVRMRMETIAREKKRKDTIPPTGSAYAVPEDPWCFMRTVQSWGNRGEDNPKYYLHMVFRYQMRLLHRTFVRSGAVLEQPSLQFILDALYPTTCSNKFPPEFKRFMDDCSEMHVNVVSLPVPKRDNAKEVDYATNFEATPEVSALRRRMQRDIARWDCARVYPRYLRRGRPGNDAITKAFLLSARLREQNKLALQQDSAASATIGRVLAAVPRIRGLGADYAACTRRTSGERLKERIGYFLRPSVRGVFAAVRDRGFVENVFDLTGRSFDFFHSFDMYCTAGSALPFLDSNLDGDECRRLLLMLERIVCLFEANSAPVREVNDPSSVVRETISRLKESQSV